MAFPKWTDSSGTDTCRHRTRPRYGYRVHGPHDPAEGTAAIPNKLLLDPYAKAIDGRFDWNQSAVRYDFGDPDSRNDDDSAASMPMSVVINRTSTGASTGPRSANTPIASSMRRMSKACTQNPSRHFRMHSRYVLGDLNTRRSSTT